MEEKRNSKGQFIKGSAPVNKGVPLEEWMTPEGIENSKKGRNNIHNKVLSEMEGHRLPWSAKAPGTIIKRIVTHNTTRGKPIIRQETLWIINVDRHGNRKPNNSYKKWLWEVYNDKDFPKGYIIYDHGNSDDLPVYENLELITRKELLRRNIEKTH